MHTSPPSQTELLCDVCAGQCVYVPELQQLQCQSCGTQYTLEPAEDHDAAREFSFDSKQGDREPLRDSGDTVHQCGTCGGEVVFTGPALSERCPYCDGAVVLSYGDRSYDTAAVIPFAVGQTEAEANISTWIRGRIAAPGDLAALAKDGRVAGIYVPFWTFDSKEVVRYWGSYKTGTGKHSQRKQISGRMTTFFDDMLVPASHHVTPLIRDGILHRFDPGRLRIYQPGYLAGFAAERHHMTVAEGLAANEADKDLLIRNRVKSHVNRHGTRVHDVRTQTSGVRYRRILLPVWILHYDYGGAARKVVVSGITGRTFGERPFSRWKLALYAGLITAVVMLLGAMWGYAAAP